MGARGNSGVITEPDPQRDGPTDSPASVASTGSTSPTRSLSGPRRPTAAVKKPVEGTILTVIREAGGRGQDRGRAGRRDRDRPDRDGRRRRAGGRPDAEPAADPPRGRRRRRGRGRASTGSSRAPSSSSSAGPWRAASRRGPGRGHDRRPWWRTRTRASATRRCSCSSRPTATTSTSTRSGPTSRRSASRSSWPATPRAAKVHVHSERPDTVIAYGLGLGALSRISVENLDHQAREVRETRASAFTGATAPAGAGPGARRTGAQPRRTGQTASPDERAASRPEAAAPTNGTGPALTATGPRVPLAVVAVAAGDGLAAIFRDFGVRRRGPRRTGGEPEHRRAARGDRRRRTPTRSSSCRTTRTSSWPPARSPRWPSRPVHVVPTRNAAEGFAALLALDPGRGRGGERRRHDRGEVAG